VYFQVISFTHANDSVLRCQFNLSSTHVNGTSRTVLFDAYRALNLPTCYLYKLHNYSHSIKKIEQFNREVANSSIGNAI
jgi:hypothetical protein